MELQGSFEDDLLRPADGEDAMQTCRIPSLAVLSFCCLSKKDLFSLSSSLRNRFSARLLQHQTRLSLAPPAESLLGVASRPFSRRLDFAVQLWVQRGQPVLPPVFFPHVFSEINVPDFPVVASEAEARAMLNRKRILRLLQLRSTAGSVEMLPPSRGQLLQSFRQPHRKGGRDLELTVGGRALSKHSVRCSWWAAEAGGNAKGSAAVINARAEKIVARILDEAVWQNLHSLPPDRVVTFEVRIAEGYGARWTADKDGKWSFRGYLEPPSLDGHETGWKH
jgi:hypothetical protein